MRSLKISSLNMAIKIVAVIHSLFILYTCSFGVLQSGLQRPIHFLLLLPLAFLLFPASSKSAIDRPSTLDYILSTLSLIICFYVLINYERFMNRWLFVDAVFITDQVLGSIAILLVLEATRRIVAPLMALLAAIALIYLLFGDNLSGILSHSEFTFKKVIEISYMGSDLESIFGVLLGISATYISLFVIFGSFINSTSIGKFFNNFANAVSGKSIGGPAKVAVFSSGLFGMVSGIGASNVYTTGVFTIPMMKKIGFKPYFAAAVEAAASTGGQYLPPVMGTAAFIMAEMTGTPYIKIISAASISGILYFFSLYMIVHYRSLKWQIKPMDAFQNEKMGWNKLIKEFYLFTPVVIIFVLLMMGFTPLFSGCAAIATVVIIGLINGDIKLAGIVGALENSAKNTIMIAVAVSCAGLIIGSITHTGLGLILVNSIIEISQGILIIVLFFVMVTCIILGMGLPCSVAYVMAVTLAAPILVEMDVDLLAAHLFCFYYAILASITPPVAIVAYAAAGIAKSDPNKTGVEAFKIAIFGAIIPFAFIYNNALIGKGTFIEIISAIACSVIGIVLLARGIVGYAGFKIFKTDNSLKIEKRYINYSINILSIILGLVIIFFPVLLSKAL